MWCTLKKHRSFSCEGVSTLTLHIRSCVHVFTCLNSVCYLQDSTSCRLHLLLVSGPGQLWPGPETSLWPINPLICATHNMWACSHTNTHVCTCSICKHRHKLILCGLCKNSFSSERPPLQQMCLLSVMYACPNSTRAPGPMRHTFVSYPVPIRVRVGEVRRGQARCGIVESSAEP